MPIQLLNIFKYLLIVLVWLFFIRVLRAVWVEARPQNSSIFVATPQGSPVAQRKRGKAKKSAKSGPEVSPKLTVASGGALVKGAEFTISESMTIGRGQGCNVPMPRDTFASSVHARIYQHSNGWYVDDLDSTNGTFVNGKKVAGSQIIVSGDRLQVGQTIFEVSL